MTADDATATDIRGTSQNGSFGRGEEGQTRLAKSYR